MKLRDWDEKSRGEKTSLYNQIIAYKALQAEPSHQENDDDFLLSFSSGFLSLDYGSTTWLYYVYNF